jgi:myo-inositol-1(or 4)-monophosphatase
MLERELTVAEEAARAAGEIIRGYYDGTIEVREKSHDNPVTAADLRSNECIEARIRGAFPGDGWLSEETRDSHERLGRDRVWIVDPLDGTKEFIQHIPELCVCIGLVEHGSPILGVSYNPITGDMFSAARGAGMRCNGLPTRASDVADLKEARVLASRSEDKRGEWDPFKAKMRVVLTGSVAFKLALISSGRADATFSLTPKNEWDICSGAALLLEAGGRITDRDGKPLVFNQQKTLLPGIIATNGALFDAVCEAIRTTPV